MAITTNTPKINRIIRMTEFDKLRTSYNENTLYLCTDSLIMYYDESIAKQKQPFSYIGVKTINDLLHNITPNIGTHYYCWEDNSLWYWNRRWINEWSDSRYPSAYVWEYPPTPDSPSNLDGVYNHDFVLGNNGLLGDGSVVIRDRNRIIKGKLYVNDNNDNLIFSSYLGGGIRFLPNGKMDTDGELFIGDEGKSIWRTELSFLNNEAYVDYTEKPEEDNNEYKNSTHRYKIFHEGNLNAAAIKILTPEDVYTKLMDPSLPNVLDLNVSHIGGKSIDEISLVGHKHAASDITDFNTESRKQASVEIKAVMGTLQGDGVTVTHDSVNSRYKISANNFKLSFGGGASGNGTINHLGDTSIQLTVDPTKHVHSNYISRMDDLQKQITQLDVMDKNDYYTKTQTDSLLDDVKGTTTPTSGKPLLVNNNLKLPGTALAADKFSTSKTVNFTGDITGTLSTDFSGTTNVALNAANIVSVTPTEGKALLVDKNGNLPGNAQSASELDHTIKINLLKEVTGTGTLDTSKNKVDINCTLVPGDNILQTKDLGVKVANIDTTTGKIPVSLIPQMEGGLTPKGTFSPSAGYPSTNPKEGEFWIADSTGTLGGETYNKGDWLVYVNGGWTHVQLLNSVTSVNGKSGAVTLKANDVGAISTNLINYNSGDLIPNGYIVKTSAAGQIKGAKVEALINKFSIGSDTNSAIEIASNSTNTQTDGTQNLGLNFNITSKGYTDIKNNAAHDIQSNGTTLSHKRYINFGDGLKVDNSATNGITITAEGGASNLFFWDGKSGTSNTENITLWQDIVDTAQNSEEPVLVISRKQDNTSGYDLILTLSKNTITSSTASITLLGYISDIKKSTNATSGDTVSYTRGKVTLTLSSSTVTAVSDIGIETQTSTAYLPTNATSVTGYTPSHNYHPATKKYVDDKVASVGKVYTTTVGNGTAKDITITHNLGTEDVIVQCRLVSTKEQVFVANTIVNTNSIKLSFANAPAANSVKVIIK